MKNKILCLTKKLLNINMFVIAILASGMCAADPVITIELQGNVKKAIPWKNNTSIDKSFWLQNRIEKSKVTRVTLPNTVTTIGEGTFFDCKRLREIVLPESITSIGNTAFSTCGQLETIELPSGVTHIAPGMFWGCASLKSITIKGPITSIGTSAFNGCRNLEQLVVPTSAESIGKNAFADCTNLELILPEHFNDYQKTKNMGLNAKKVIFSDDPASVLVEDSEGDVAVEEQDLPQPGVQPKTPTPPTTPPQMPASPTTSIQTGWWNKNKLSTPSFAKITQEEEILAAPKNFFVEITLNNAKKCITCGESIGEDFVQSLKFKKDNITGIGIPQGVKSIGHRAFANLRNLNSVTIPESVETIGDGAFANCPNLGHLKLPTQFDTDNERVRIRPCPSNSNAKSATTKQRKKRSFQYFSSLEEIEGRVPQPNGQPNEALKPQLPAPTVQLNDGASPKSIWMAATSNLSVPKNDDSGQKMVEQKKPDPKKVEQVETPVVKQKNPTPRPEERRLFSREGIDPDFSEDYDEQSEIKAVESKPYSVNQGNRKNQFKNQNTQKPNFPPKNQQNKNVWAKPKPNNLPQVTTHTASQKGTSGQPKKPYYPKPGKFQPQKNSGIAKPSQSADWPALTPSINNNNNTVEIELTNGERKNILWREKTIDENFWPRVNIQKDLVKNVTVPASVTTIGFWAFINCNHLESITLPPSITSIGEFAFGNCSNLQAIEIPEGVTSIGDCAFSGCENLFEIVIPETVKTLGEAVFRTCKNLVEITIPKGITSIAAYTFFCCEGLKKVTLPETLNSIGASAFAHCWKLEEIVIPQNNVKSIGEKAFEDCYNLKQSPFGNQPLR